MDFAPDLAAGMISPQPILFIHGEKDDVCPVELTLRMFARCGEPKKIIIIDGLDHIDLDHGDGLKKQVDHSLDWFRKYL